MDFYSSIKCEDASDQNKLRSQAIALAPKQTHKLRYSILTGNNSRLIRLAMEKRTAFWQETTKDDPHFHFKWQPVSHGLKFDILGKDIPPEIHMCQKQLVNHFESHSCLSTKSQLYINMSFYSSEKLNENVFDYLPLQFFVECDISKQKQYSKSMVQFMNAFYTLDDIKKRTIKFYQKEEALDEQYIFKHYYQNKISMIKQHKKEEKEERDAYLEAQ